MSLTKSISAATTTGPGSAVDVGDVTVGTFLYIHADNLSATTSFRIITECSPDGTHWDYAEDSGVRYGNEFTQGIGSARTDWYFPNNGMISRYVRANIVFINPGTSTPAFTVWIGVPSPGTTVTVSNFPATQPVSGTVSVSNFPATQPVSGSVGVSNFPATQTVAGTVGVNNFPSTQTVAGSVSVSNLPATQAVSGTVSVSNFPASQPVTGTFWQATQPVSGTVAVSNLPATQPVSGTVSIAGTVPVSGTFWQATQPVSGTVTAAAPIPVSTDIVFGRTATTGTIVTIPAGRTFYGNVILQSCIAGNSITSGATISVTGTGCVPATGTVLNEVVLDSIASLITTQALAQGISVPVYIYAGTATATVSLNTDSSNNAVGIVSGRLL